jgi:hypothetical protein
LNAKSLKETHPAKIICGVFVLGGLADWVLASGQWFERAVYLRQMPRCSGVLVAPDEFDKVPHDLFGAVTFVPDDAYGAFDAELPFGAYFIKTIVTNFKVGTYAAVARECLQVMEPVEVRVDSFFLAYGENDLFRKVRSRTTTAIGSIVETTEDDVLAIDEIGDNISGVATTVDALILNSFQALIF